MPVTMMSPLLSALSTVWPGAGVGAGPSCAAAGVAMANAIALKPLASRNLLPRGRRQASDSSLGFVIAPSSSIRAAERASREAALLPRLFDRAHEPGNTPKPL